MSILQRARTEVEAAETALRELTAEAAAQGDYDAVQLLADWAKQLSHLRASGPDGSELSKGAKRPHQVRKATGASKRKGTRRKYPRFSRNGETLIKTSWSKKRKQEYNHKAPSGMIGRVLNAFDSVGARNRPVATQEVFPLEAQDGSEVPSYQAYLALACLRDAEVVLSRGRDGYQLDIGTRRAADVAKEVWEALPVAR